MGIVIVPEKLSNSGKFVQIKFETGLEIHLSIRAKYS